jgi:predicted TIM-barrel fold metal-dependent hydrolase
LIPFGDATVKIFKRAADYGIPVLLHCADEMMCLPLQIEMAMERAPDTVVMLAHVGGFFHTEDVVRVCERKANAYIDTSEMPNSKKLKFVADRIGPERLLFGTDIPTDNPELEIYKVRAAGFDEKTLGMIFWKNIAKLLDIRIKDDESGVLR